MCWLNYQNKLCISSPVCSIFLVLILLSPFAQYPPDQIPICITSGGNQDSKWTRAQSRLLERQEKNKCEWTRYLLAGGSFHFVSSAFIFHIFTESFFLPQSHQYIQTRKTACRLFSCVRVLVRIFFHQIFRLFGQHRLWNRRVVPLVQNNFRQKCYFRILG